MAICSGAAAGDIGRVRGFGLVALPLLIVSDSLNSDRFAREIDQLCGYDTDQMGKVMAEIR